jgi:hypothetical protein
MIFVSYPRTGVNFLSNSIEIKTGVKIKYTHSHHVDDKIILNIVRDPKDSMVSWISMMGSHGDPGVKNNDFNSVIEVIAKNKYISMYKFLLSLDTIFINYHDFNNIDKLIYTISNILNLPYKDTLIDKKQIYSSINSKENFISKGYLITSKNTEGYLDYKEKISEIDLSECYDLYYKALKKCIKLDNEI